MSIFNNIGVKTDNHIVIVETLDDTFAPIACAHLTVTEVDGFIARLQKAKADAQYVADTNRRVETFKQLSGDQQRQLLEAMGFYE